MFRCGRRLFPRLFELETRISPAAGQLDPSFGVGGLVTTQFPKASDDFGRSIAIDSLGRILVAGYSDNGFNYDAAVTRYTSDGALDPTFGGTGVITFPLGPQGETTYAVAVDEFDRVLVAGDAWSDWTYAYDFAVARLTTTG